MTAQEEQRKRPDYVTLIAVYHFIGAGLGLLVTLGLIVLAAAISVTAYDEVTLIWSLFGIGIAIVIAGIASILDLAVAIGLLRLRAWARWVAIVLAILGLPGFPVGTAFGVLILVYLLGDEGRQAFE